MNFPPIRSQASIVLICVSIPIGITACLADSPGVGVRPRTFASAVLLAVWLSILLFPLVGSLFSVRVRGWLFKPSKELEESALSLIGASLMLTVFLGNVLHRAWELYQLQK